MRSPLSWDAMVVFKHIPQKSRRSTLCHLWYICINRTQPSPLQVLCDTANASPAPISRQLCDCCVACRLKFEVILFVFAGAWDLKGRVAGGAHHRPGGPRRGIAGGGPAGPSATPTPLGLGPGPRGPRLALGCRRGSNTRLPWMCRAGAHKPHRLKAAHSSTTSAVCFEACTLQGAQMTMEADSGVLVQSKRFLLHSPRAHIRTGTARIDVPETWSLRDDSDSLTQF